MSAIGDTQPAHGVDYSRRARPEPGTRLLAIVGASHESYLEAYLNRMHDLRPVDADAVLR